MNNADFRVNIDPKVFNKIYTPYLDEYARTQIFFGGSSSGKSVFVIGQRVIYRLLKGSHNFLICRQNKTSIRGSVSMEINRVISEWGLYHLFKINKTDGTITCINGNQVTFAGLDDVEKLKSITFKQGALTDIIIEEATETEKNSIKQLMKRQRGKIDDEGVKKTITLLFNPIYQQHWIYQEYFKEIGWTENQKRFNSPNLTILKTTYKDNDFLTKEDIADLESESDSYYFNVYTLGNWGILGHTIFTKWRVEDLDDPKSDYYLPDAQRTNLRFGLDFGFSADPAALWCSHYDRKRKRIYFFDELYQTGLTNDALADGIRPIVGSRRVTCDSADTKSIAELQRYGINATGAKKGKDSVLHGIQWLQQHEIIIHKKCLNARNEIMTYHWQQDAGGNALPKPVPKGDHLIDAGRYAHEEDMTGFDSEKLVDWV